MTSEQNAGEQKEQAPRLDPILKNGFKAVSFLAHIIGHADQYKDEIEKQLENSFEQFVKHPDMADKIAINLGGDLVNRFQEKLRENTEERTAIHQKTVETMSRFRRQQVAHQDATKQEQEAAQKSQEAARDIDELITTKLQSMTGWLNNFSGRKS
jgi:altronate dehydratase